MSYDPYFIDELACALAVQRAVVEVELIGAILSIPARGVALAIEAGVSVGLFEQDDLRAIFVAVVRARDRPKVEAVILAKGLLVFMGLWDRSDHRRFGRGMRWCDEALAAIACSFPGPAAVPSLARKLKWLDARQRQARASYRRMIELLNGSVEPTAPTAHRTMRMSDSREGETYANHN